MLLYVTIVVYHHLSLSLSQELQLLVISVYLRHPLTACPVDTGDLTVFPEVTIISRAHRRLLEKAEETKWTPEQSAREGWSTSHSGFI